MASDRISNHPLTALRSSLGLSATQYLELLNTRHRALGHGAMALRREKVSRWESGQCAPELTAQLAMANLHGVAEDVVHELGWPGWLLEALPDRHTMLDAPWTPAGALAMVATSLKDGPADMDRRGFLMVTGSALAAVTSSCAAAMPQRHDLSSAGRGRLTTGLLDHFEQRQASLRYMDDLAGGGALRPLAIAELRLLAAVADQAGYGDAAGRRLFGLLAEAARICGWHHFDSGLHSAAQKLYLTALRAAAAAADPIAGANVLAFMAIQAYTIGSPFDAVHLAQSAQQQAGRRATPRVACMLHARAARALSRTPGGLAACAHQIDKARANYAQGTRDDDPPWSYWVTEGEIEMLAGSCALDLGRPDQALRFFDAARTTGYPAGDSPRDYVLYLTRIAETHLAAGDIEHACAVARQAADENQAIDSARTVQAIANLARTLKPYARVPAVRDFLEYNAHALASKHSLHGGSRRPHTRHHSEPPTARRDQRR